MNLFENKNETRSIKEIPLAARMRPSIIDEIVGQKHIIGKDKLLYRAIKADRIDYLLWSSGNRKDDDRKSDREYDPRGIQTVKCDKCGN